MAGYRRVSYYELCRLCTASDGTKMHIFREEGRRRQIPTKIQLCLPLQINEEDALPKSICTNCLEKLESFFNFRESCLTAETMLEGFQDFKREGMVYVKDDQPMFKAEATTVTKAESPSVQVVETSCMVPVSVEGLQNLVQAAAVHIIGDPNTDKGMQYKIPIPLQLQCGTAVLDSTQQIRYNIAEVANPQTTKSVQEATQILQTTSHKETHNFSADKSSHTSGTQTESSREVIIGQTALNSEMFVQFANFKDTQQAHDDIVHRASITGITNINDYLRVKGDEVSHELEEAKDIECGRCGKRLSSSEVTEHCISCFDQQPTTIISEHQSTQITSEKIASQADVRSVETISIQYSCEYCGKIFKKKETFEAHQKSHTVVVENENHQLSEFVRVAAKNGVPNHLPSQDEVNSVVVSYQNQVNGEEVSPQVTQDFMVEVKPEDPLQLQPTIPCDVCGKPFKRKEHLFQHRKLHSGERPFVCSTCGKAFGRKEHLLRHMLAHTGQKVHDCNLCGKSFSRKDNLLKHKKIHGISGPFSCETCGKSFVVKHYYLLHMNSHMSEVNADNLENPHRCDICNKVFSDKSHLATHKARHRSRPGGRSRQQQRLQQQTQQSQQQQQTPQQTPQQSQPVQQHSAVHSPQLTQVVQCQSPVQQTTPSSNEETQEPLSTVNTAAILAPSILHTSSAQVFQMPAGTAYLCTPTIAANQFIENIRRLSSPAT